MTTSSSARPHMSAESGPTQTHAFSFRPDIQGLRALAVLLSSSTTSAPRPAAGRVRRRRRLLRHLRLPDHRAAPRARRARPGRISLAGFYARRARRILPGGHRSSRSRPSCCAARCCAAAAPDEAVTDAVWAALFAANIRFAQRRHRLLRRRASRPRRCSTTGRCRSRSSSTSSGRCCSSAACSCVRRARGRPAQRLPPQRGPAGRRDQPGVPGLVGLGHRPVARSRRTSPR